MASPRAPVTPNFWATIWPCDGSCNRSLFVFIRVHSWSGSSKEAIEAAVRVIATGSKRMSGSSFLPAAAASRPKVQMAPLCVLLPLVTRIMAFSAALPIAASVARSGALGCSFIDWNAMRRMNGSIVNADLLIKASDKSVCAPDPRLSTKPGFGVSSASAISACRASVPSMAKRWMATDSLIDRAVL